MEKLPYGQHPDPEIIAVPFCITSMDCIPSNNSTSPPPPLPILASKASKVWLPGVLQNPIRFHVLWKPHPYLLCLGGYFLLNANVGFGEGMRKWGSSGKPEKD